MGVISRANGRSRRVPIFCRSAQNALLVFCTDHRGSVLDLAHPQALFQIVPIELFLGERTILMIADGPAAALVVLVFFFHDQPALNIVCSPDTVPFLTDVLAFDHQYSLLTVLP